MLVRVGRSRLTVRGKVLILFKRVPFVRFIFGRALMVPS